MALPPSSRSISAVELLFRSCRLDVASRREESTNPMTESIAVLVHASARQAATLGIVGDSFCDSKLVLLELLDTAQLSQSGG